MNAPVGSLAAEASQLLDVLAGRLTEMAARQRTAGDPAAADGSPTPDADGSTGDTPAGESQPAAEAGGRCPQCGHDPAASVSCTGCPLCAALALLRGERPEAAAKLAAGALTIVQTLRGLLAGGGDAATAQPDGPATPGASGGTAGAATDPVQHQASSGLHRIDIR